MRSKANAQHGFGKSGLLYFLNPTGAKFKTPAHTRP